MKTRIPGAVLRAISAEYDRHAREFRRKGEEIAEQARWEDVQHVDWDDEGFMEITYREPSQWDKIVEAAIKAFIAGM